MARDRLYLFDTTLRDGAQTAGIEFSLEDKIAIARLLEELGVDYVEGGYPGANPVDTAFFDQKRTTTAVSGQPDRTKAAPPTEPAMTFRRVAALSEALLSEERVVGMVVKIWTRRVIVRRGAGILVGRNVPSRFGH